MSQANPTFTPSRRALLGASAATLATAAFIAPALAAPANPDAELINSADE